MAQKVIIMADSTKFGRRGLGKIGSLDQVDYIITDSNVPSGTIRQLEETGIKLIIADKPNR